jgi:glycosyltransferase involved in cell wall biosynthesis
MRHKFSIVIPTRERANTLRATLQTCVAQDYDNLEIIVSDNVSGDHTREVVDQFVADRRVRYVNPGQRLSMARSFEFALSHVQEGQVITLGDDDGLPRKAIIQANEIFNAEKVSALTSERAQYDWPGMAPGRQNQVAFSLKTGWERRSTKDFYPQVLNGWMSYYQIPLIYHCYFSHDILKAINQRFGRIFNSQQLDIYSSMLFGGIVANYAHSHAPLVINGASAKSNGAQHFGQVKDSSEVKKWEKENDIPLRPPFEFVRSIRFLLAESYFQAYDVFPEIAAFPIDLQRVLTNSLIELRNAGNGDGETTVREVARKLGVELKTGELELQWRSRAHRLAMYVSWLRNFRSNLIINCSEHQADDIEGAARLMSAAVEGQVASLWNARQQLALAVRRR